MNAKFLLFLTLCLAACYFTPAANAANCADTQDNCDQGIAFTACKAAMDKGMDRITTVNNLIPTVKAGCTHAQLDAQRGVYTCLLGAQGRTSDYPCLAPTGTTTPQGSFYHMQSCGTRELQDGWSRAQDTVCYQGCKYKLFQDPVSQLYYHSATNATGNFGTCTVGPNEPAPEDEEPPVCDVTTTDCDGDGDIDNPPDPPCDPTTTDCDGDGDIDNPPDPPCDPTKADCDGDGDIDTPPGDGDGTGTCNPALGECGNSSGGTDCASQPVSTGDPLLGMVIKQQWFIRCGKSKADQNGDGQPDWTEPKPGDTPPDDDDEDTALIETMDISASMLDDSGFGIGASCPAVPAITIMGATSVFDNDIWCMLVAIMRACIILVAVLQSIRILME